MCCCVSTSRQNSVVTNVCPEQQQGESADMFHYERHSILLSIRAHSISPNAGRQLTVLLLDATCTHFGAREEACSLI